MKWASGESWDWRSAWLRDASALTTRTSGLMTVPAAPSAGVVNSTASSDHERCATGVALGSTSTLPGAEPKKLPDSQRHRQRVSSSAFLESRAN